LHLFETFLKSCDILNFFGAPKPEPENIPESVILSDTEIALLKIKRNYERRFRAFVDSPELLAFKHIIEAFSIAVKPSTSCQAFPGFKNLLNSYLGITDLSDIVSGYACTPFTITLSIEKMLLYFDPNIFHVAGCNYVSITWHSGVSITVNYTELSIVLNSLNDVFCSRDGFNLLTNMFHNELTLSFFGNIESINISRCLVLTKVLEFPALAHLTEIIFSECTNLRKVPSELPGTVLSLAHCLENVPNAHGFEGWNTRKVVNFKDALAFYKGARYPDWNFDDALSIERLFYNARNIHPRDLKLTLPKCVEASSAFFQTTNLCETCESIVIYAPQLLLANEMFNKQASCRGVIYLVVSPKFVVRDDFACSFFNHNVGREKKIQAIQAGRKPFINQTMPCIISTEDVSNLEPEDMFKMLPQPKFIGDNVKCLTTLSPQLASTIVRAPNRFGRMKTKEIKPLASEVLERQLQPGVDISEKLLKNSQEPCKVDVSLLISEAIKQADEEMIAEIGWIYKN